MSEKKTEAVEILPPEQAVVKIGKGKVATVATLQSLASQIDTDFNEYEKHERAAMFFALRIGVTMVVAKELCDHGDYLKWIHKSVRTVRLRQAYNFRALAEAFIEQKKLEKNELLLLTEPPGETAAYKDRCAKTEQLLLDFIGGRSQAELFAEYGIQVRDKKPKGGANQLHAFLREKYPDHPEYLKMSLRELPKDVKKEWEKHLRAGGIPTSEQFNRVTYQAVWRNLIRGLRENGLEKKTYSYLDRRELEELHGTLIDVKKEIMEALKK